jgi:hypothetical protein
MAPKLQLVKATLAVGVSLGMALLTCLSGCWIGAGFSDYGRRASLHEHLNKAANMECCDAPSGGNSPAKNNQQQHHSTQIASCCPPEAVLSQTQIAAPLVTLSSSLFATSRSIPALSDERSEAHKNYAHSGRETLLETHLLRI